MSTQDRVRAEAETHGWTRKGVGSSDYLTRGSVTIRVFYTSALGVLQAARYDAHPSMGLRPRNGVGPRDPGKLDAVLGWLGEPE